MATTFSSNGTGVITLAEGAALMPSPAPTLAAILGKVEYQYKTIGHAAYIEKIKVSGTAFGASKVRVALRATGVPEIQATKNVGAQSSFAAEFTPAAETIAYGTFVTIGLELVGAQGSPEQTTTQVGLGATPSDWPGLADAAGCFAGFEAGRNKFVAGHPDRLIRSRSFVPLSCAFFTATDVSKTHLMRMVARTGVPRRKASKLVDDVFVQLEKLHADVDSHFSHVHAEAAGSKTRRSRQSAESSLAKLLRAPFERLAKRTGTTSKRRIPGANAKLYDVELPGGVTYGTAQPEPSGAPRPVETSEYQGALSKTPGSTAAVAAGLERYVGLGWLGILFYDQLRLRPSGLVAGEPIFALSLAPGEELTLTQRTETKRSKSFEEVLDRTAERELEFSSTWSTSLSQEDAASETSTVGGNLGVSIGIPIDGIELGINAGVDAQSSSTVSSTRQSTRAQQLTTRVAARSREQHKTTFKVGTDVTDEFGSKRVIRNANPVRALTLTLYKLYLKTRVLLERHDAKLCLSLCVHDPGRDLRKELKEELAKLDPHVPSGACPDMPTAGTVQKTQVILNDDIDQVGGDEYGAYTFSTVLPAGTVLSGYDYEIVTWTIDDGVTRRGADVTTFVEFGGESGFATLEDVPVIGSPGAQKNRFVVLMPEAWGPGWFTVSVEVRFSWHYVPDQAMTAEVKACIEAEKKKIRDSFSVERVLSMLSEVEAGRRDLILKRVVEDAILRGYFAQRIDAPCDVLEIVRNAFEWNEAYIEYLPWWLSSTARDQRDELRKLLLDLPGDTPSDVVISDFLVAAAARVFLPIKPGQEAVAMSVLAGGSSAALKHCIDDFVSWRASTFAATGQALPIDQDVMSPAYRGATAAGSSTWAYAWEQLRRRFLVLDEWSDLLPTDGVHMEPALSTCGSADEFRSSALISDLESAAAARRVDGARAALEDRLDLATPPSAAIVVGDPLRTRT